MPDRLRRTYLVPNGSGSVRLGLEPQDIALLEDIGQNLVWTGQTRVRLGHLCGDQALGESEGAG